VFLTVPVGLCGDRERATPQNVTCPQALHEGWWDYQEFRAG
jgi:hypothetical protein